MEKFLHTQIPAAFGNKLIEFMGKEELSKFIKPFVKYGEEKNAIIAVKGGLYAIYTTGSKIRAF